jgi:hypothetical protein
MSQSPIIILPDPDNVFPCSISVGAVPLLGRRVVQVVVNQFVVAVELCPVAIADFEKSQVGRKPKLCVCRSCSRGE